MLGRARRKPGADEVPRPAPAPWHEGDLRAEWALLPVRRRRDVPSVVLTCGAVRVHLLADEVRDLVRDRIGVAESVEPPTAFLCRPDAAASTSVAADLLASLPSQSLALLVAGDGLETVAVVTGPRWESFVRWALELPR